VPAATKNYNQELAIRCENDAEIYNVSSRDNLLSYIIEWNMFIGRVRGGVEVELYSFFNLGAR